MKRQCLALVMAALLGTGLMGWPAQVTAVTQVQDDPVAQCAEGVQLFLDGQYAEALPLLEAGFAGREEATFADPDDLGTCALRLGRLRDITGDGTGALEAYAVALEIFQTWGNPDFKGATLSNIGSVYNDQGRYAEALEAYQQALAIAQELGDRAHEGTMLNNIGETYRAQGRYAERLEAYQQALTIWHEAGNRADEGTTLNNIGLIYHAQGHTAEALEYHQQALATAREVGNRGRPGGSAEQHRGNLSYSRALCRGVGGLSAGAGH